MSALVVQYLVTLGEAARIMRPFKQKKHSKMGYYFDLQDLGAPMHVALKLPGLEAYGAKGDGARPNQNVWYHENAYILRVYRDTPAAVNR